ncbi:hypothetical protein A3Q56_02615 [Intoshia linei]|uniref:NADH-cytochrome b5 reductase n=1 Tax=Intoshia linei TaxID=1819745 RepID=A0A177B5T4_9BILA|nr:hypothetical protein A3Q56_02615 [Intoshia linei]
MTSDNVLLKDHKTMHSLILRSKEKTEILNYNTYKFNFKLPSANETLGFIIGSFVILHGKSDGEEFKKSYTPVSDQNLKGQCEFVIKIYRDNQEGPGGLMTQYLESLHIGDSVDMRGPMGLIRYFALDDTKCRFTIFSSYQFKSFYEVDASEICMIAGGTGITPMYQLIQHNIKNNNIKMRLMFGNNSDIDTILFNELEKYRLSHPELLNIYYTATKPFNPEQWTHGVGNISPELIQAQLLTKLKDKENTVFLLCGPRAMVKLHFIALAKLGIDSKRILRF